MPPGGGAASAWRISCRSDFGDVRTLHQQPGANRRQLLRHFFEELIARKQAPVRCRAGHRTFARPAAAIAPKFLSRAAKVVRTCGRIMTLRCLARKRRRQRDGAGSLLFQARACGGSSPPAKVWRKIKWPKTPREKSAPGRAPGPGRRWPGASRSGSALSITQVKPGPNRFKMAMNRCQAKCRSSIGSSGGASFISRFQER